MDGQEETNINRLGHVLVTGASGFVGRALCAELMVRGHRVAAVIRQSSGNMPPASRYAVMGHLDEYTDWRAELAGADSVIHLAARVHLMQDSAADPLGEYRRINVALTLNLARQAATAGVRRFIFVSSIKVNGEGTVAGRPYTAEDEPHPSDFYGISKLEAEQGLVKLSGETGMEVVIIRPVLVYGPGVKANFGAMMRCVYKGVPLPLGALSGRRSLVSLDNLVDLIVICLRHRAAANQVFLVSDGEDLTVTELLRRCAAALGRPARLIPVPVPMLRFVGYMVGKQPVIRRLCDPLQVDISKTRRLLGWEPPVSVDHALRETAQQILANARS